MTEPGLGFEDVAVRGAEGPGAVWSVKWREGRQVSEADSYRGGPHGR